MKNPTQIIPWLLFVATAVALLMGYQDSYRLFMRNHILSSSIECLARAAAHGETNDVVSVLQELWEEMDQGRRDTHDACIAKRDAIIGVLKDEHFPELSSGHQIGADSSQPRDARQ
jgi:hypothetical protein